MENQCCCEMPPKLIRRFKKNVWLDLKLLKIFQFLGYQKRTAFHCASLGQLYQSLREYDKSEQMLVRALEINQKTNHKEWIAKNYFSLGNTYLFQGKYEKAEDAFSKAQFLFKESGDDYFSKLMFFNLGSTYMSKGELDKAEEMYLKYIEVNKKIDSPQIYLSLSRIYKEKKDNVKEKDCLQKAADILKNNGPKGLIDKIQKKIDKLSTK
jgi:tetratricopeptide (TPR) repeat protein